MVKSSFSHDGWDVQVFASPAEKSEPDWQGDFAELVERLHEPDAVLKHDHRSQVGIVHLPEGDFVVKKFTLQRTWFWFQLTSLAFPALGEVTCNNAFGLHKAGLLTPIPSLLLQRREKNMVVESWIVYRYLQGMPADNRSLKEIIPYVRRMHEAGWVHRDPHPGNFLITDQGPATLDSIRAKKTNSKYLRAYDVMLMSHDMPGAVELYGRERLGIWLTLAEFGHDLVRFYRRTKYLLRRMIGLRGRRD